MKKKTIYAMLSCSACGGQTDSTDTNGQKITLDTDMDDSQQTDLDTSDVPSGQQSYYVTLDWQTTENSDTAEDGTLLYTSFCTYPVVSIEENQDAADNINASIQEYVTTFTSYTSIQNSAREDYVPENPAFITYYCNLSFAVCRSDSNIIFFTALFDVYSGGPHNDYGLVGVNYDTRTGEHISFAELGEDAASFRANTFAFNRILADSAPYQR